MLYEVITIVRESEEGLYDAAVLGRRGLSWFEEMVSDSVSHRILWEELTFPICVITSYSIHYTKLYEIAASG